MTGGNPNKAKGDKFERDARDWLAANGFPDCERTRAGYARDYGDLHLDPRDVEPGQHSRIIAQAKNRARWAIPEWLTQLAGQRANAGARYAFLIVKRPRVTDPGKQFCVMEMEALAALLWEAGYGKAGGGSE